MYAYPTSKLNYMQITYHKGAEPSKNGVNNSMIPTNSSIILLLYFTEMFLNHFKQFIVASSGLLIARNSLSYPSESNFLYCLIHSVCELKCCI